jgi:hypothetical protein
MTNYRAYFLNVEGHVLSFVPLHCATDAEAIAQANRLLVDQDIEIWELGRKIAILRSKPITTH